MAGTRLVSPLTTISATATATEVMKLRSGATYKLKKIWMANDSAAATDVYLCKSDKTQLTPKIRIGAYSGGSVGPEDLPEVEFTADIYAVSEDSQPVELIIEVEEVY